jgi:hypothetical protein
MHPCVEFPTVPTAHSTHALAPQSDTSPAGHAVQASSPPAEKLFTGHCTGGIPLGQKLPGGHGAQPVALSNEYLKPSVPHRQSDPTHRTSNHSTPRQKCRTALPHTTCDAEHDPKHTQNSAHLIPSHPISSLLHAGKGEIPSGFAGRAVCRGVSRECPGPARKTVRRPRWCPETCCTRFRH